MPVLNVNGDSVVFERESIMYDEVLELAGYPSDSNPSMTYSRSNQPSKPHGILLRHSDPVLVKDGTYFFVVFTGDA